MKFKNVDSWSILDEKGNRKFVKKVIDKKTEKVLWEMFHCDIEFLSFIGCTDYMNPNNDIPTPMGIFTRRSGEKYKVNSEDTSEIFGKNDPIFFKLGEAISDDEITFYDSSEYTTRYAIILENTSGDADILLNKYTNCTGEYTGDDLTTALHKYSGFLDEGIITGGTEKQINLYNYKTAIMQAKSAKKVIFVFYYEFNPETVPSWDLTDMSVASSFQQGKTFSVTDTYSIGWSIDTSVSWIDVGETEGAGDETDIMFSVSANTTKNERTGIVYLYNSDKSKLYKQITITQAGANITYSLTVDPKTAEINSAGGSTDLAITASSKVTYSTSDSWLTLSMNSGYTKLTVTASANLTTNSRSGKITLSCGDKTATVTIVQGVYSELTVQDSITVSPRIMTTAGTLIVSSGKRDWTFISSLTGATAAVSFGNYGITITTTAVNEGTTVKTLGTLTITDGVQSKTVTVKQDYARITATINNSFQTYSIGSTVPIELGSNSTLSIESNTNWTMTTNTSTDFTITPTPTKSGNNYVSTGYNNKDFNLQAPLVWSYSSGSLPQITITYGSKDKSYGTFSFSQQK